MTNPLSSVDRQMKVMAKLLRGMEGDAIVGEVWPCSSNRLKRSEPGEWIQGLACEATEPTWHRTPEPEVFCPS
jgi:hypothetical protein